MPVIKYNDVELVEVNVEGANEVKYSRVITEELGWDGHCLRLFRINSGGYTPHHAHDWEHVNYIIKGTGEVTIGDKVISLTAKDFAFVPPNVMHQFRNNSDDVLEFICIVPKAGDI